MKTDSADIDVKVKRQQLTKWEGDVPPEYQGIDVDPNNPPPQVKEILVAEGDGPFEQVYRRPG